MASPTEQQQSESTKQDCFLCTLDRHPCATQQLRGRIVAAYERPINGELLPFVTIDLGGSLASIGLTRYYRSLIKELIAIDARRHHLSLHVYHLPAPPSAGEHTNRPLLRYEANPYTLAVVEPDVLLNITDLSYAEYCSRQYLLQRLISSPPSAASIRGNLVHYCFKELLKEHDRGKLMNAQAAQGQETPLAILQRHFEQALEQNRIDLELASVSVEAIRADVAPHLESIATWFQNQSATLWDMPAVYEEQDQDGATHQSPGGNQVRAETFLLAPEIGLRGRLDLFWQQSGRQRFLELKTGGGSELPKSRHRNQVLGYHAQLTVRRDPRMKKALATLLYSGTPAEAQAYGVPFDVRNLQRVNEMRNLLVLSHVTGIPPAPPGPSRCAKCAMLNQCLQVSDLLGWQPPEPAEGVEEQYTAPVLTAEDRAFFAKFYHLLQLEGRESERQMALLWQEDAEARLSRGAAIKDLTLLKQEANGKGEWLLTFACDNQSELREGDEILISDGDPVTGSVVTGTITEIGAAQVTVWVPELIANPRLIDKYETNQVHTRTLQNLYRWLHVDPHLRDLVSGKLRPRFTTATVPHRADFNDEQNLAVVRALQMQDYLLIQGPPGTGKTSVIAEIVKRLCRQGQRVLLAAFTNQAVDNMLKRLDMEDFHDYIRLGHERNVHDDIQKHLLKHFVGAQFNEGREQSGHNGRKELDTSEQECKELDPDEGRRIVNQGRDKSGSLDKSGTYRDIGEILRSTPVIASTTATWSSNTYDLQITNNGETNHHDLPLQFDVAIIDEASQLTIPAILGALRFAQRFILVGDEKQLPPLVLSKEAAEQGLSDSLFSYLKRMDDGYRKHHPQEAPACVSLTTQYRMNKWISNFASKVFYEGKLEAAPSIARRVLEWSPAGRRPGIGAINRSSTINRGSTINREPTRPLENPAIIQALQPAYPLVFLDVTPAISQRMAKSSDAEARAVRDIVRGLLICGIEQKDIGIIAPYRAQVANIRRHLLSDDLESGWQGLSPDTPMSIDTVDRFQGGERMVIIISFATSQAPEAQSQLREFLTNPNRLNVALTRAQRKLILVGCAAALRELPYFGRLLAYCESMKTVFAYYIG